MDDKCVADENVNTRDNPPLLDILLSYTYPHSTYSKTVSQQQQQ